MIDNKETGNYSDIDKTIDEFIEPHVSNDKKNKKKERNSNKQPVIITPSERFSPDEINGLTSEQVQKRISQNLVNAKGKQMTRSSAKIIFSNLLIYKYRDRDIIIINPYLFCFNLF